METSQKKGLFLGSFVLALAACGGGSARTVEPAAAPPAPAPAPAVVAAPAKPAFENPGGMWMPSQIPAHAETLRALGLAIDPGALSDPTSGVLSAIVFLGGCSASFVSPDGLVATNHHCATSILQRNSTPQQNLLKDGYLAKDRAAEKPAGPEARVFVTRALTDVTAKMREGVEAIADDLARQRAMEGRQKAIVAACEAGRPEVRCSVASFYEGATFILVEQLEIKDVRLVWAPPGGVGNFGGEIDNWRWPRHSGDVTLLRAYVGPDGKPAAPSPANVPYKPAHHLRIAKTPLRAGDLVMVAGYPGRTSSWKTHAEVEEAVLFSYPRRQQMFEAYLERLAAVSKDDPEAAIKATPYVRGFGNGLTNTKGQLEGLLEGGLLAQKAEGEQKLDAFVAAEPSRKRWAQAIEAVRAEVRAGAKHREADAELEELRYPKLVSAAFTVVRMAEERAKPDAERHPDFQARNWPRHEAALTAMSGAYHPKVDQALLALAIERAERTPAAERSGAFAAAMKSRANPAAAVKSLYDGTKLADEKTRLDLFKTATTASLAKSTDPLVRFALAVRPFQRAAEERRDRRTGKMDLEKPKVVEARRAMDPRPLAPDANATLRITYGTVRGYKPKPDAPVYAPFTTLSQIPAKDTHAEPFDVPEPVRQAIAAKKKSPYVDPALGDVPVDFLSDLHITGGNSGSATLDARGDLVGLAFDGNYEAMASDWQFLPAITRSIHVDMRYVLWLLDVYGAKNVLEELR